MKRLLHIFIIGFLVTTGNIYAQGLRVSGDKPESIAKEKVDQIVSALDLNGNQERALFRAYVKHEVGFKKYIDNSDLQSGSNSQEKANLVMDLEKAVRKELTAEQFERWKKEFAEK